MQFCVYFGVKHFSDQYVTCGHSVALPTFCMIMVILEQNAGKNINFDRCNFSIVYANHNGGKRALIVLYR